MAATLTQDKRLAMFRAGKVTAAEVANALLADLILDNIAGTELKSRIEGLPPAIVRALSQLLGRVRAAKYDWDPFRVGPGGPVTSSRQEDQARLRQICESLAVA